jgi:hypothetical protein
LELYPFSCTHWHDIRLSISSVVVFSKLYQDLGSRSRHLQLHFRSQWAPSIQLLSCT